MITDRTERVLTLFEWISEVPRPSGKESAIAERLINWAEKRLLLWEQDQIGNLVIRVPASPGKEKSPCVVLQGHLDMVCEKTPGSAHDFERDPIRFVREGEWLTADETSLGADNGAAVALALDLVEDPHCVHPPLELLFTVDEETGLEGALNLNTAMIKGRTLINLDSEDEGIFTIGCAGGRTTLLSFVPETIDIPKEKVLFALEVGGLSGGHSGVQINENRANANRLAARVLDAVFSDSMGILDFRGGSAHNAIPRDARVLFCCDGTQKDAVLQGAQKEILLIAAENATVEKDIRILCGELEDSKTGKMPIPGKMLTAASSGKLIRLLLTFPDGVVCMSSEIPGLVETSSNLATVKISDKIEIVTSQRSSVASRLDALSRQIAILAELFGVQTEIGSNYPGWQPRPDSPLLKECSRVYRTLFSKDPVIEAIHAGLECGVIGASFPGMMMISMGPTIKHPHSPDEKMNIRSVGRFRYFLGELLAVL